MTEGKKWTFATTAVVAALIALAAIATMALRIPIPATTGYFNIGDVFVVLAGLWLGPLAGAIVGGVGPTIADAIGFPVFIPATMITKGMEGFIVGLIASRATEGDIRIKDYCGIRGRSDNCYWLLCVRGVYIPSSWPNHSGVCNYRYWGSNRRNPAQHDSRDNRCCRWSGPMEGTIWV